MAPAITVEGNEEAIVKDGVDSLTGAGPPLSNHIADPIVYKLVRVEGDGRLVPATDDEVMAVEDLLEDDKTEVRCVADTEQNVGCTLGDGSSSNEIQRKSLEGPVQTENFNADAGESNLLVANSEGSRNFGASQREAVSTSAPLADNSKIDISDSLGGNSISARELMEKASTSALQPSSKPDFSKLKGEVCLDNLTVKELQETFRATFGRETSVKDKQWLKRRISMGLSNSCDFSTTTFLILDNQVMKKGKDETSKNVEVTVRKNPVPLAVVDSGDSSVTHNDEAENPSNIAREELRNSSLESNHDGESLTIEQRAAKRIRKPTKRYIEELSEEESKESSGKLMPSVKHSGHGQASPRDPIAPIRNIRPDGRTFVTRQDSIGGSGVQVPYVSRVRRGRPRENFIAFTASGMGRAAKIVEKPLLCSPQQDEKRGIQVFGSNKSPGSTQQPVLAASEKSKQYLERDTVPLEGDVVVKNSDSIRNSSDENMAVIPSSKGGVRRKHHRPWTLSEVVNLVEGVSRYGAGRWSEIKRLAFASYAYRTSVDLKDKWRNLLRASFAQLPAGVQSSRKHASIPIPTPILLRVRELAEMQGQVPPSLSASKVSGNDDSGRTVDEERSGYL